ncbi:MAG TPA: dUTP diphosphatase [Oscillospiraceae bacterium]|nr:dUTP diphosphatase [Oscillospiraceae bacterium]
MAVVKLKRLDKRAKVPTRATSGSAGYDISALLDSPVTIAPGEVRMIPTGLAIELEDSSVVALIYPRSSLASKHGITLANCVGVIDSDYRGELQMPVINLSNEPYTISLGERISQLVLTPVLIPDIEEVEELSDTVRGTGGFGSTGKL